MSTIKLELTVDANNIEIVTEFLGRIAVASVGGKKINDIKVDDAEEVKAPEAEKPAAKSRPSRAKAKPQPEPEPEPEEDEDEDLDDEGLGEEEEAEETISLDDLRVKQAEKVAEHRAAIKAKLIEFGATGLSNLEEKHYEAHFNFLSKLK